MIDPLFQAGGALTDEHETVYIERQADRDTLTHLRRMDYLLVIEPRQQGKTSLINHFMRHPALGDTACAYVDVTTPDRSTEATWYQTLCPRILRQLRGFISPERCAVTPQNSAGWREFLCEVAMCAANAHQRVVIALDEIGATTFPGATAFFSVLRDTYNSRQAETELKQLTFLLSGAFHPRDLIRDDKISPFNIAQRVRLADFTAAQVHELVSKGDWVTEQATALAERIHYWTDGQPYLIQLLCSYLMPNATPADVDAGVERLRRYDENHLPPMLADLHNDAKLRRYIERISAGERIKFYPRENRRQAQLELLGVIKADAQGFSTIRNRIYSQSICASSRGLETGVNTRKSNQTDSSVSVPQELGEQLSKGNVVLFVGAGLSIGAGLPGWGELVHPLAERIGYPDNDLLKATQFYENRMGRQALISYLRDKLDTVGVEPTANHNLLALLPADIIFTTNFDDLLERAYHQAGRLLNLVVGVSELPFWDASRSNLVKLHGTYDRPNSFIVTERDYHTIYQDRALIVQQLNALLTTKTFLFVGYSVGDPDFNQIYDQLRFTLGRNQRRPYLVTFDVDEFQREDLEQRGFHVIILPGGSDRNTCLETWLRALHNMVSGMPSEDDAPFTPFLSTPNIGASEHQPPKSPHTRRSGDINFELGLHVLKQYAESADWQDDFDTFAARLHKALHDQRLYEPGPQSSQDQWRVVENLNILARDHLDISFNDLCMGRQPRIRRLDQASDRDITALIQDLAPIIRESTQADREASEQLRQAIQAGWVEPQEIASRVDALRRWARSVQKTGLPVDDDLRTAILCLTQPAEGMDGMYNYLLFALPLLPGLLSIESEIDLNQLWTEIRERWGKIRQLETKDVDLTQVTILLEGQIDKFTRAEQESLVFALSRIINVPVEQIRVLRVAPGSVLVTLEMPEEAAQRLLTLYLTQDSMLQALNIEKVEFRQKKGQGFASLPTQVVNSGKAWAVLVGINKYEDPYIADLKVCTDDVTAIQQALAGQYEIARSLTDATPEYLPTRSNILGELSSVAQAASEEDLLLFYFSGHGIARDGESYLLARDTRLSALKHTAVAMGDIRELVEQSPAHAKVIVLEACHSGASIGKAEPTMSAEFIQQVFEQAEGIAILASCKENQQSWEWSEKHRSVFTYYVLSALAGNADFDHKGFVTVSDVSNFVTDGVRTWAASRSVPQTPTLQYTVAGDIILLRYDDET